MIYGEIIQNSEQLDNKNAWAMHDLQVEDCMLLSANIL